jgi:DNA-binding transcriptional LysR family regulator
MNLIAAMRYLVALDKHRHFGRAAEACHVSQPALSNGLRALEEEFGVAIVRRSRVYGGLTPEGEVVLETARRTLRDLDLLTQEMRGPDAAPRGPLRIGIIPTAVPLLSLFLALLRRRHPEVRPVVLAMSSPEIDRNLDNLSIDLAMGYTERHRGDEQHIRTWPLTQERYFLLRRREGPPAEQLQLGAPMHWSGAAKLPLCQLTPDMHNRAIVDGALNPGGSPPEPASETNALLTLVLTVSAGAVVGVLPGAMIGAVRDRGELEALPLVDPEIRAPVGFIALAEVRPSRATEAAIALLQDEEWKDLLAREDAWGGD